LTTLLRDEGFSVIAMPGGREAMKYLRESPPPQLIVLDLMMPNMDGHRFRNAQVEDPRMASIPTIVITADARATKEKLGVAACFRKPFDVEALLNEIARLSR
jgi:CheY-like chemotaxis protein